MAGAAPQARFSWQAQHSEHLQLVLRGTCSTCLRLVLHGRCSTLSTSGSFCMAGAALEACQLRIARHFFKAQTIYTPSSNTPSSNTPSSRQHHLHNIINTISPTQPHQLINTSPSTQHHLHYIIKHWQVRHLGHCHLTPSASFLLISLFVFLRCGLFFVFVSLAYSTVGCPKTLLTCGIIRPYNSHLFSIFSS